MSNNQLMIYTDGGHRTNGSLGGWAFYIENHTKYPLSYNGINIMRLLVSAPVMCETVTNNRMELTAAIKALEEIQGFKGNVKVHSDSQYVINSITKWMGKWAKKNYKGIKNADLMRRLNELNKTFGKRISWQWVKGHADCQGNIKADKALNKAMNHYQNTGITSVSTEFGLKLNDKTEKTVSSQKKEITKEAFKDKLFDLYQKKQLTPNTVKNLSRFCIT